MTSEQSNVQAWSGVVREREPGGEKLSENIRALQQAIIEDVAGEAAQVLADARSQAEAVRAEAETQANAEREARLQRARQAAETVHDQTAASAQIEAQTLRLKRREQLLARAFADARGQLASAPQWPDYPEVARRLVHEGVEILRAEEIVVRADAATGRVLDNRVLGELGQELGVRLNAGEPLSGGTGVVVETADGHRRYDNTLETRLARMQDSLRTPVFRILAGEAV
jgi:vacuolar-type H+-ATPase subunit E/Vma4